MELLKKRLTQWRECVQKLWAEGSYIRASLTFLVVPVVIALMIVLVALGISAVVGILRRHYAELIAAALGLWAFAAWWDKHKAEKIERESKKQELQKRQEYANRLEAAQTETATYEAQAKVLFSVARELGALGIAPPATLSGIYSPRRMIPSANGTVRLSLFLLPKDRETVDTDLLKHIAQTKIDQRLQAGEFPGIPDQHVYRGRVYSGLTVDMVRDSPGGFVEVYTAFVDDAYCRYNENRELNKYRLLPSVDRRDTDY